MSPVSGKLIIARFDGGFLSSYGGLLALREVEAHLGVARRLAEMLRFRLLMIAAGYEDGNDAASLRHDPLFMLLTDARQRGRALLAAGAVAPFQCLLRRMLLPPDRCLRPRRPPRRRLAAPGQAPDRH